MRNALRPLVLALACGLALVLAGVAAPGPVKRRAPDLVVGSVGAPPPVLQPGDRFAVGDRVRNAGNRVARRFDVGYYLSANRRFDAKDVRLAGTRSVRELRAGWSSPGSTTLLIPRSIESGEYLVLACADASKRVRERNERNNCRAAARSTAVSFPPAAPTLHDRPGSLTSAGTARFVFSTTAGRPPVRFSCQLDGGPFAPCASPVEYSSLREGAHAFLVKAHDRDGRESGASSFGWRVDLTPPPTPALSARPVDPTNVTTASFSFAGSEAEALLECTLDWGPVTVCESPQSYTGLSEGRHVFAVRARDRANNESAFQIYEWTVDVTPPAAPAITAAPPELTNSPAALIAFSSAEGGVVHRCSLDGAAFANCSSPQEFAGLAEGQHTFAVKSRDAAGNESAARSHTWRTDTTAPAITLSAHPGDPTSSTGAQFGFSTLEDVTGFRCRLDGGAFAPCASPASYTGPLSEGLHTFAVSAKDAAGNEGSVSFGWRVDTTPPLLGQPRTFPENPTNERGATFTFSDSEPGLTYLCRLDSEAAFSPCANPQTYPGLGHGAHTFEAKVRDAAGNESNVRVHRWMISTTLPPAPGLDIGVFHDGGPPAVRDFQNWLGRPITLALEYIPGSSWETIASPDEVVSQWHLSGYNLVYSTPMLPGSSGTLEDGARGAYDTYFGRLAETLVRYGQGNVVIRLGWEFNGNWFAWKAKGKTAEFITYWRRIVNVMRGVSPQFKFDWNPAYGPLEFDADQAYPGDAYVDYIGLVVFDQGWEPGYHDPILRWRNFVNLPFALEWHQDFARQHNKPMTFPEWGLTFRDDFPGHGGGDNPYYIEKMYLWMTASQFAYAIYFEHDKPGSVRHSLTAGHFPNATKRFKELFGGVAAG